MNKKQNNEGFCCPEFVPPGTPNDFCIPEHCCPQRLETPKFPSPTSCLPEEQRRRFEELIDAANELLLDLALSNERPEEGKMKSFEGLIGQLVEVKIDCVEPGEEEDKDPEQLKQDENKILPIDHMPPVNLDLPPDKQGKKKKKKKRKKKKKLYSKKKGGKKKTYKKKTYKKRKTRVNKKDLKRKAVVNKQYVNTVDNGELSGRVHVIGSDFVLLRRNKEEILIPLIKISLIKPHDRFAQPTHEPELLDIDPCLRRALTFNFGETVASSPELIKIFFNLTLPIFLLIHLDKKVKIKVADEELEGTLMEINKESLVISIRNEKVRVIPLLSICFIIIKSSNPHKSF